MTRIYTLDTFEVKSCNFTESDLKDIISEYNDLIEKTTPEYSLSLEKELDPLKDGHKPLKLKHTGDLIYVGLESQEGFHPIVSYNVNRSEWYSKKVFEKEVIFGGSLLHVNIDHMEYNTLEEFSEDVFLDDDDQKWKEWKKDMGF